tara:strand:+ start:80 stop:214 length:135 start_codon:yes stop_codon:yes gene_type:complete
MVRFYKSAYVKEKNFITWYEARRTWIEHVTVKDGRFWDKKIKGR